MNEEIEYAEMLEIPVSTVNVIKKKKRGGIRPKADLKETLIKEVNERVEKNVGLPAQAAAPARLYRVENPSIATEKKEENAEEVKGVASEKATDSTAEKAQKEKSVKTEKADGANKAAPDKIAPIKPKRPQRSRLLRRKKIRRKDSGSTLCLSSARRASFIKTPQISTAKTISLRTKATKRYGAGI